MEEIETLSSSMNVGGALEYFRSKSGLNKTEFSEKGDISLSYYSEIVSGKKVPTISKLKEFCSIHKIPFHFFVFIMMQTALNKNDNVRKYLSQIRKSIDNINELGIYHTSNKIEKLNSDINNNKETSTHNIEEMEQQLNNFQFNAKNKLTKSNTTKKKIISEPVSETESEINPMNNPISELVFKPEEIADIEVKDPIEIIPVTEVSTEGEKRYILEDYMELEENLSSTKVSDEDEGILIFEEKTVAPETTQDDSKEDEIDPLNSPISKLLVDRAAERKRKMKEFNFKFHHDQSRIEDIDKQPAYKRMGIDLDEKASEKEGNLSRTTLPTDKNEDTQLRSNNSFLHDNVD